MCGARDEHASCCRFNGDIIRAAVTFDIKLRGRKCLRVRGSGGGKAGDAKQRTEREYLFGHVSLADGDEGQSARAEEVRVRSTAILGA